MALDKNKIIAEATKLVQRGSYDKAIATYQRILSEDSKDVRVLLKVGELYQKKNDGKLAADAFTRVAETYAEQGFFLKAVAVYKQIVKLAPEDVRVNERLAALYQQLGLLSDAMGQLQYMAAAHERAGDSGKLTDVLQRMVDLDPENIASSIKLGELHARAGRMEQALECLRRAADYLKKHSRTDEYLKVAERISALKGDDLPQTKELANIYLAKGDTKRALAKLQLCFKADPRDVDTLQLLAQAFRDLGQTAKTLSVYKELAHVHMEQGRQSEARNTWRKVQELAPDDPDASEALGPVKAAGPATRPQTAPPPGAPPGVARPPPPKTAGPISPPVGSDTIQKLLTETDVYVKYGLHEKALDHLRKVLSVDPQSPEAHERAREIHVAAGRPSDAGTSGVAAVQSFLARGMHDRARDALLRLRQIDPGNPAVLQLSATVGGTEELEVVEELIEPEEIALDPAAARPAQGEEDELAIQAAGDPSDEVVDDEPLTKSAELVLEEGVALEVGEPEPLPSGDEPATAAVEPVEVQEVQAEEVEQVEEPKAPPPVEREAEKVRVEPSGPVFAFPPPRPAAPAPAPAGVKAIPPAPLAAAPAAPPLLVPPAAVASPQGPAAAPIVPPVAEKAPAAKVPQVDLSDELEEASFFLQQGLLAEARDALKNLLDAHPGHRRLLAKMAEVDRRIAAEHLAEVPKGPKASPSRAGEPEEGFDIARELAEELDRTSAPIPVMDDFQYSVEDVFSQFKKGVEATVKPEDSATHYDLGIAYREMGLIDDALNEFETALKGNERRREVDCLTMVGLCRMALGEHKEAITAYRRALGSEFLTRDAAKALHLELGAAYEAAGQKEAALYHLQKVLRVDAGYRDVAARVKALGGGPGHPPADEPRPAVARPQNGAGVAHPAPARVPPAARPVTKPDAPPVGAGKKNIGYL